MTSEVHSCVQPISPTRIPGSPPSAARAPGGPMPCAACAACAAAAAPSPCSARRWRSLPGRWPSRRPRRAAAPAAASSVQGSGVVALQRALGIAADGIYGPQTRQAVRAFQRSHGLVVDGIAGPQTLGALGLSGDVVGAAVQRRLGARADRAVRVGRRPDGRLGRRALSRQVPVLARDMARDGRHGRSRAGARVRAGRSWPPSCSPRAAPRPGRTAASGTTSSSAAPPAPRACAARVRGRRRPRRSTRRPSSRPCWRRRCSCRRP